MTTAAAGKSTGMSGRDLFTFQAHLLDNSDDEDGEEDDFDVHLARVRAEAKARSDEIERHRQLGQCDVGKTGPLILRGAVADMTERLSLSADRDLGGMALGEEAGAEGKEEAEAKEGQEAETTAEAVGTAEGK